MQYPGAMPFNGGGWQQFGQPMFGSAFNPAANQGAFGFGGQQFQPFNALPQTLSRYAPQPMYQQPQFTPQFGGMSPFGGMYGSQPNFANQRSQFQTQQFAPQQQFGPQPFANSFPMQPQSLPNMYGGPQPGGAQPIQPQSQGTPYNPSVGGWPDPTPPPADPWDSLRSAYGTIYDKRAAEKDAIDPNWRNRAPLGVDAPNPLKAEDWESLYEAHIRPQLTFIAARAPETSTLQEYIPLTQELELHRRGGETKFKPLPTGPARSTATKDYDTEYNTPGFLGPNYNPKMAAEAWLAGNPYSWAARGNPRYDKPGSDFDSSLRGRPEMNLPQGGPIDWKAVGELQALNRTLNQRRSFGGNKAMQPVAEPQDWYKKAADEFNASAPKLKPGDYRWDAKNNTTQSGYGAADMAYQSLRAPVAGPTQKAPWRSFSPEQQKFYWNRMSPQKKAEWLQKNPDKPYGATGAWVHS